MAHQITTDTPTSHDSHPSPAPEEWLRKIAILTNRIETLDGKPTINQLDAPTAADRQAFERRNRMLKLSFGPAPGDDLREIMTMFFAGYPALQYLNRDEIADMMDVYALALQGLPLWAVNVAIAKVVHEGLTPQRPPTAPEMARAARAAIEPFYRESSDLDRILAARITKPEASPEARAAAARRWQEEIRPGLTGLTEEQEAEERRRREEANARMIQASERHVATINREAGIPKDHWPHSVHLRRKLVEMGADFGGRTGVGDVLEQEPGPASGGGGGRKTRRSSRR